MSAAVAAEGLTVTSTKGTTMAHPALRELKYLSADLLAMEKELGLTPRSRVRLGLDLLAAESRQDALEAFLADS